MRSFVGIDLGGTKIAAAALRDGALGGSHLHATERSSLDALLDQIVAIVDEVRGGDLDGVGIGVPSVVEFATGRAVSSVNIPLVDVPLREVLSARLEVPVFVDNDATLAAFAEAHDRDLRMVARNLVMLTLGTGVGGGLVLGGRIYRGATGAAAEFGHMLCALDVSGGVPAPADFPQPGSIESIASGRALDRLAHSIGMDGGGADAVQSARDGDPVAGEVVQRWARFVGIAVANVINIFDPDEVVLGGGAAVAGELLLGPARDAALGYVLPGVGSRTSIRLARHGVRAGVLGAALLAEHELCQTAV
ncbi:MAG: ROK family protein [Solirubrobacteraceae bacterium]